MVCSLLVVGPVAAEIKPGATTLSPFVGGYVFEGNQNLENKPAYGLGVGYNFDEHWAAETVFNYIDTDFKSDGRSVDTYLYHVDALYHFMPSERLVPYVAAGGGGMIINPGNANSDHDFAVNYGAGFKYFLNENLALRGDVRHVISFNETQSNLLYTAGLNFSFGGNRKVKQAAKQAEKKIVIKTPEPKKIVEEVMPPPPEPKPEKKTMVAPPEPKVEEKVIILEDIHFKFDLSTLTKEAQMTLKKNIQTLKENTKTHVRIAGYASASGTAEYNQKLSERRARAVTNYLINEGLVTPDRLTEIGYGETRPAMYEAAPKDLDSKSAMANMRVLFEIIVK
jgi:OOP family OmpA-OmpF porin